MTIREMHFDFKMKYNSVDSQKDEDFQIPEIDWLLNEAQEVFVKLIGNPRLASDLGFETNQRTIDDIRTIVVNQDDTTAQSVTTFDSGSYIATLPTDYWFYLNSKAIATKNTCSNVALFTQQIQHDDEQDMSPFDRSSFFWRVANIRFIDQGIRVFNNNGEFVVSKLKMDYVKTLTRVHNAQDFGSGSYITLDGVTLTGQQSCVLPKGTHSEIVDLAVAIATIDKSSPYYQLKQSKLLLTK